MRQYPPLVTMGTCGNTHSNTWIHIPGCRRKARGTTVLCRNNSQIWGRMCWTWDLLRQHFEYLLEKHGTIFGGLLKMFQTMFKYRFGSVLGGLQMISKRICLDWIFQTGIVQICFFLYTQVAKQSTQRIVQEIVRGHFRGCSRLVGGIWRSFWRCFTVA